MLRVFVKNVLFGVTIGASLAGLASLAPAGAEQSSAAPWGQAAAASLYIRSPLTFVADAADAQGPVNFTANGAGFALRLTPTGAVLELAGKPAAPAPIRMSLVGANPDPKFAGEAKLPGQVNYLIGSDRAKWRTALPGYGRVRYRDVYPGVDLVYYGNQRHLEYDFVLAPGADPAAVALRFEGATPTITAGGDLALTTGSSKIVFGKPALYQEAAGRRQPVQGAWRLTAPDRAGFEVAAYDRTRTLVIDPVLAYSTLIGGSGQDFGAGIAVDANGNFYVVGSTCSADLPTTPKSYDPTPPPAASAGCPPGASGEETVFVAKFAALSGLAAGTDPAPPVYITYLGGSYDSYGNGIAADSTGAAYVVGQTYSPDFPLSASPLESSCAVSYNCYGNVTQCPADGDNNARNSGFVTKLTPDGSGLAYSTFLGGSQTGALTGIAVDAAGEAYVTGWSSGIFGPSAVCPSAPQLQSYYPTTSTGYQTTDYFNTATGNTIPPYNWRGYWVFSKLSADGGKLLYSTDLYGTNANYSGGNGSSARAIAIDPADGTAVVGGITYDGAFPTTKGALQPTLNKTPAQEGNGNPSGFVAKFDPSQSGAASLVWSSFFAGSGATCNAVNGVAVDAAGNAYVAGTTGPVGTGNCTPSLDLPTSKGAFQQAYPGADAAGNYLSSGWVAKFDAAGKRDWATYLGGTGSGSNTALTGIAVDAKGHAFVTGCTNDSPPDNLEFSFPQVRQIAGLQPHLQPVLVTEFSPTGRSLLLSTLMAGGGDLDCGSGIALDTHANSYVAGSAADNGSGINFPTTPGAFQTGCADLGNCGNPDYDAFAFTLRGADTDLGVSDSASPNPAMHGQTLTYTITAENAGTATGSVSLATAVPAGTRFQSASITSGSCAVPARSKVGMVRCGGFSLAPGATATLTLNVVVTAAAGATITDTAAVKQLAKDYDLTNNAISVSVTVQ